MPTLPAATQEAVPISVPVDSSMGLGEVMLLGL
jgi:hypothetical protein